MIARTFVVAACSFVIACTSTAAGTNGSSGSSSNVSVTGTLGGEGFAAVSGVGHVNKSGSLSLLFVDAPNLCGAMRSEKFPAGLSLVQLYNLTGTAPGSFVPVDSPKYATLESTCPSSASVNDHVAATGRATPATTSVTIDSLTDTQVSGEHRVQFDDGSSVEGSFDLPLCEVDEAENATCE